MKDKEKIINSYYDILVQNAKKMETYSIKLKNDPRVYTSVPMIPHKFQDDEVKRFTLRILAPDDYAGLYERSIDEIEMLEKKKG